MPKLPSWIRCGAEVRAPSGRMAKVEGISADGFVSLEYLDGTGGVRLHYRLVAPRNGEPVRVGARPSRLANEVRLRGLPGRARGEVRVPRAARSPRQVVDVPREVEEVNPAPVRAVRAVDLPRALTTAQLVERIAARYQLEPDERAEVARLAAADPLWASLSFRISLGDL